ncbi:MULTISPECIES: hypothetical protein [unclassified Streptomyces]|uniref:hypothetical protein n=1 Tax=unclassified Streptomyces TaxID=2593676 RepID=UPI0038087D8A
MITTTPPPPESGVTLHPAVWTTPQPGETAPQRLHIRLSQAAPASGLRLTWPTDPAGPHLQPTAWTTPTSGWELNTATPGTITARRTPTAPGPAAHLDLDGIIPGPIPGPIPITITTMHTDTGRGTGAGTARQAASQHILYLDGTDKPQITAYEAKDVQVDRQNKTTLSWSFPRTDGAFYLTQADNTSAPAEQKIDPQHKDKFFTWTTPPLTADTAFALLWKGRINGEEHTTATCLTLVMVKDGDISAGTLSANNRVSLFGTPQNLDKLKAGDRYGPAPTDGIALASLRLPTNQNSATATVSVLLSTGETLDRVLTVTTDLDEANTQVPVPCGAVLDIVDLTQAATLSLCWVPMGTAADNTLKPTKD